MGEQLTYSDLDRRANQLAHHLRSLGAGPETLVGISIERSLDMLVGLLGILKAGGAYVPMDPTYPRQRLGAMLSDSQIGVLLTQERLLDRLPEHTARVVCLDILRDELSKHPSEAPRCVTELTDLAYVIYTSGTTGRPKGVMIEHGSLAAFTEGAVAAYSMTERDRVLQFASLSFDAAGEEIYPCLAAGGTLVLRTDEMIVSSAALLSKCADWQLTVLDLPTAYWAQLTSELGTSGAPFPRSVRLVIIGGEQALPGQVEAWKRAIGSHPLLVNSYGPTETTIASTAYRVPVDAGEEFRAIPVGRPMAGAQTYILDPFQQLVPIGARGELYIGGPVVGRGYLNDPELTRAKFIDNPFATEKGSRLFRTGDAARYLSDHNIELLGRLDNQIKIHGYRIELGEIESALSRHEAIAQAAVTCVDDESGGKRLVSYLVLRTGAVQPGTAALRRYLAEDLPDFMLPAAFVWMSSLPLGPHGKVDRNALPAPDLGREEWVSYRAPRDEHEEVLAILFCELLNVARVGIDDDFFALGGHSLVAMQLTARIKALLGVDVPAAALFEAPTIAELSRVIRSGQEWRSTSLVPIQPRGTKPPFFCVHGLGGPVISLRHLGHHLGTDQPTYGIQAIGLDGKQLPHTSVEAMASHYLAEIRTVQPAGPYFLGGWSFGGVIAFEMAQQLRASGASVALVAFFDSGITAFLPVGKYPGQRVLLLKNFVRLHYAQWARLSLRHRMQYITSILARHKNNVVLRQKYKSLDDNLPTRYNVLEAQMVAALKYRPQPYDGKLTLFQSAYSRDTRRGDSTLGWGQLTSNVEVQSVPGDHNTMLQPPNVRILAEKLAASLEIARGQAPSGALAGFEAREQVRP